MAQVMRMPEVLTGMVEAAVQTWLVSEGDTVAIGTPVAEVETEKAMVEIAADTAGVVAKLLIGEGDAVGVGAPILELRSAAEHSAASPDAGGADSASADASDQVGRDPAHDAPARPSVGADPRLEEKADPCAPRVFASPIVRRLAREHGIDLTTIRGTGDGGRIVRRDLDPMLLATIPSAAIEVAAAGPLFVADEDPGRSAANAAPRVIPLTGMRKAIARRLSESKSTVPHFYLTRHCDVSALLRLRSEANEASVRRVSVNDFVVKATARALMLIPQARVIWGGDHLAGFDTADIAVAVATDNGLLTPVVRRADALSVSQLSATIADLADRARAGRLRQDELEGGSFAVSNLGMYGVDEFSAILNPPQSGILAVGAIAERAVVIDGALEIRPMMTVTVSWDHRAVDGAVGAEWLRAFAEGIERPLSLML